MLRLVIEIMRDVERRSFDGGVGHGIERWERREDGYDFIVSKNTLYTIQVYNKEILPSNFKACLITGGISYLNF